MAAAVKVAVVSSVHRWNDTRVYVKQARSLAQAGYDVTLAAVAAERQPFEADGIRVVPLVRRRPLMRWLNWLAILRTISEVRPRIVHAHDPELFPFVALLRLFGRKVVCDVHEDVAEQILHKEWIVPWLRPLLRRVVRRVLRALPYVANAVVLAEDSYAAGFAAARNVVLVRNYPLLPDCYKTDYATDVLRMIYIGDVRIVRGIETYVRLVHALVGLGIPTQLSIVGSFADRGEERRMHGLANDLGVAPAIGWLGRRPPDELPRLLAGSDVGLALLHPIGNYRESYPTKMFEYMASGVPAVASDFALWRSVLVANDCGQVVDPMDIGAITGVIASYWGSAELRQRHGQNGRRAAIERYQWGTEAERLLAVYRAWDG